MVAVAGAVDVDADRGGGEAVEDRGGEGGVAEVLAPLAQLDVGGQGGRGLLVACVEHVEEHVRRGGLVVAATELAEADVVDDEPVGADPAAEATRVGLVGEAGVEVVDEIDAAGVADGDLALAGAEREGLQDVALAGARPAGDEEVVALVEEGEGGEALDEGAVELGLEDPVEVLEGLADPQAAGVDATLDAALADLLGGLAEDALEEDEGVGRLGVGPGEVTLDLLVELPQSEAVEVGVEALEGAGLAARWGRGAAAGARAGGGGTRSHGGSGSEGTADQLGRAS